jgi:hypothetical protein
VIYDGFRAAVATDVLKAKAGILGSESAASSSDAAKTTGR